MACKGTKRGYDVRFYVYNGTGTPITIAGTTSNAINESRGTYDVTDFDSTSPLTGPCRSHIYGRYDGTISVSGFVYDGDAGRLELEAAFYGSNCVVGEMKTLDNKRYKFTALVTAKNITGDVDAPAGGDFTLQITDGMEKLDLVA